MTVLAPNVEHSLPKEEAENGTEIIRFGVPVFWPLSRNRILLRGFCTVLLCVHALAAYYSRFRKEKIDVIQAEHVYSIPAALLLRLIGGGRVFADDITTVSDMLGEMGKGFLARLFTLIERGLFPRCDEFVYTSEASLKYSVARGAKSFVFVPNGVDCVKFAPVKPNNETKVFLLNASSYFHQNLRAIENFHRIGRALRDMTSVPFRFHLISGPKGFITEELTAEFAKEDWFAYEEFVPDIEAAIQRADCVVLPYETGDHLTGGPRLKALEALSCGKTVVSTPEGVEGIQGLVPGRHLVVVETPEDIPSALADFLESEDKYEQMGIEAREFVLNNYDWHILAKPLLDSIAVEAGQASRN